MAKRMVLLMLGLMTCVSFGATTHLALDTRTGTRYARAEEPITFSTDWNAGVTRLVLNVDGANVLTATTATNGVYVWKPDLSAVRTVTVKHTTRGAVNEALTATFTTVAYDVTFDAGAHGAFSGGGAAVQRVPHGEGAETPEVVPAAGYRFTGWNADISNVTGDVTATAQYEAIPYSITYEDLYGATHGNPSTYTVEDAVTFTAPGSIPRRQFVRWEPASIAAGSTGAVTVRAIWETTPCVYVDAGQGNDAWDGSLADQAVKTLARAYELAEPGDVILVAAGTYAPVTATGKAVTFRGADGATINGGGTQRCVTADDDVVFENVTIQNGYDAEAGGGVYGGTFVRCTIRDCVSEWDGGGAYGATLWNCVIVGNEAVNGWGGGAYGGTLDHCVVKDNVAGDEGGGVYEPASLSETTFSGNLPEDTADVGGIVTAGGSSVYVPSGSSTIHSIPHDWLMAAGLAKVGDSTTGLDAKLAAPYAPGYTGWEAFVAGLTATDQVFRAEVEMADGEVRISWMPNLNTGAVNRIYAVLGRTDLDKGDWETPIQPWHRFFKVTVAMPTRATGEQSAVAGEGFVPEEKPLGGVQLWENGPYWAECNVGATKPEEYGYYFWWGDTVGYTRDGGTWTDGYHYSGVTWVSSTGTRMSSSPFDYSTCPTSYKSMSKLQSEGYVDATGNLVAKYDAATAHLGTLWRMPTDAEFSALVDNCTTTWTTRNGVYGRLVTGKGAYASKSIFLPAAGYGRDSFLYYPGLDGRYWSSTPNSGNSGNAWNLYFYSADFFWSGEGRHRGLSVRPLRGFAK